AARAARGELLLVCSARKLCPVISTKCAPCVRRSRAAEASRGPHRSLTALSYARPMKCFHHTSSRFIPDVLRGPRCKIQSRTSLVVSSDLVSCHESHARQIISGATNTKGSHHNAGCEMISISQSPAQNPQKAAIHESPAVLRSVVNLFSVKLCRASQSM